MLESHCPESDIRWTHEYEIFNFVRRWLRIWSMTKQQQRQIRCLQKVRRRQPNNIRLQPNHTRWQLNHPKDVIFHQVVYPKATRRPHNSYTTSYLEYDAFELNHEGLAMVRNISIGTGYHFISDFIRHPIQEEAKGKHWLVNTVSTQKEESKGSGGHRGTRKQLALSLQPERGKEIQESFQSFLKINSRAVPRGFQVSLI